VKGTTITVKDSDSPVLTALEQWPPARRGAVGTPGLHLQTCLVLDDEGRILSTREPEATPGPLFTLVRSATACAWAVRADVPAELARELDRLAGEEPPAGDLRAGPVHGDRYLSLLAERVASPVPATKTQQSDGPAFEFPPAVAPPSAELVIVEDERLLEHNFRGWVPGEIAGGRAPVVAIVDDGHPVSICFCARRSDAAAEAGLATAESHRGRGLGPLVTAGWALAIRASGLVPLYSTSWTNHASLAVARKLGLIAYASSWALSDQS
jgi:hypothetical protein